MKNEEEGEEYIEVVELLVNIVVGILFLYMIKLKGSVNGEDVVVLIDSGVMYNFILESLV